jgi:hypothetical protein
MKVEMGKKYTSNGKKVRILCVDRPYSYEYPVVGMLNNGSIEYFKENGESFIDSRYNLIEVWQPQAGEWCWFWDDVAASMAIHLRMYLGMKGMLFKSIDGLSWDNCAKFIGELPEHLKNTKNGEI